MGLTANYVQGSFGKPAAIISDPNDPFASPPKYVHVDDIAGLSFQVAGDYAATERLTVRGWAYLNRRAELDTQFDDRTLSTFDLVAGSFRERVTSRIRGVTLQPRYEMGKAGKVTFSLATETDIWNNSGNVTASAGVLTARSVRKSLAIHSASAEYEVSPLPRLGLVAGYGHFWQSRDEHRDDEFSLLAGGSYDISEATRLKASFKRNIRFPSLGDLYDLSQGNPNLDAERAITYEAGIEQKLPLNSRAAVTVFYTEARNLIQNDQAIGKNTNLTQVNHTGVELTAQTQPSPKLLLRGSYAYLDALEKSRPGREEQQYTPRDKVILEWRYDADFGLTSFASLLWVGNQYFYTKNNVTPVVKAKLENYGVVNVRFSQKVLGERARIYVGADNLLDANYETSYGFPHPGRFIYGGAEFRI